MPFTPLHMGPGIVVKATLQNSFSLMVFGWSQIVIDIQPLVVMLTNKGELHGFSHTFLGATLIGLFGGLTGKHLGEFGLRFIRAPEYLPISWRVSFASGLIGTYSHIFIDSIMHSDVLPLLPFSTASPLNGIVSIDALHVWCVVGAIVGGLAWFLIRQIKRKRA
jgi:membrane-bound metal-dependent hydrolase YbcI (DUF457 family)